MNEAQNAPERYSVPRLLARAPETPAFRTENLAVLMVNPLANKRRWRPHALQHALWDVLGAAVILRLYNASPLALFPEMPAADAAPAERCVPLTARDFLTLESSRLTFLKPIQKKSGSVRYAVLVRDEDKKHILAIAFGIASSASPAELLDETAEHCLEMRVSGKKRFFTRADQAFSREALESLRLHAHEASAGMLPGSPVTLAFAPRHAAEGLPFTAASMSSVSSLPAVRPAEARGMTFLETFIDRFTALVKCPEKTVRGGRLRRLCMGLFSRLTEGRKLRMIGRFVTHQLCREGLSPQALSYMLDKLMPDHDPIMAQAGRPDSAHMLKVIQQIGRIFERAEAHPEAPGLLGELHSRLAAGADRAAKAAAAFAAVCILAGCTGITGLAGASGDFSCERTEDGLPCASLSETFARHEAGTLPHQQQRAAESDSQPAAAKPESAAQEAEEPAAQPVPADSGLTNLVTGGSARKDAVKADAAPADIGTALAAVERLETLEKRLMILAGQDAAKTPERVPERIATVYIAPWTDDEGDLHGGHEIRMRLTDASWKHARPAAAAQPAFTAMPFGSHTNVRSQSGGLSQENAPGKVKLVPIEDTQSAQKSGSAAADSPAMPQMNQTAETAEALRALRAVFEAELSRAAAKKNDEDKNGGEAP